MMQSPLPDLDLSEETSGIGRGVAPTLFTIEALKKIEAFLNTDHARLARIEHVMGGHSDMAQALARYDEEQARKKPEVTK